MFMEVGMPWTETRVVDEKMSFIVEWQRGEVCFAELCRRYGISRQSGHELKKRFEAEGLDGVKARSKAPHHHPNAVSAAASDAEGGDDDPAGRQWAGPAAPLRQL